MAVDGDCDSFCWWEASDVFEEGGMPQSEFSGTFGLLTLNGIPKATLNAFRFLNRLRGGRMELRHDPLAPGCNLVATAEGEDCRSCFGTAFSRLMELERRNLGRASWSIPWNESAKPVLVQEKITAGAGSCYETWQSLGLPHKSLTDRTSCAASACHARSATVPFRGAKRSR